MNLELLDQKIQDVQWKLQNYAKNKASASFVAYIDARQVMNILDKACGKSNWQDKYEIINGVLFCHIGIKIDNQWIWKSDCGTESSYDKEKGEASDAFKRTAVKWGVGRFLYELPIQWITTNAVKDDKENKYPYPIDENGNKIKDVSKFINDKLKISEIKKDTELQVTSPEKTPAPLPLTTKNNDVVGQKKVKVPFDFTTIETALDYLTSVERIEEEALKIILENNITESDLLGINSVKDKVIAKLQKKLSFFDDLKSLPVTECITKLTGVLKYYPDYKERIGSFIIPATESIKFKTLDDAKAIRSFFVLQNSRLQGDAKFESFFEDNIFKKFK